MSQQDEYQRVGSFNFTLDLIEAIKRNKGSDENIFVSPFSINVALAMTLAGARQETAAQMKSVMKLDTLDDSLNIHDTFKAKIDSLVAAQASGIKLHIANRMYVHDKRNLLSEFKQILEKKYDSTSVLVDFEKEYEKARLEINKWVEETTANKIKDLLVPGVLDANTRLVLVNAIYFKGNWAKQFNPRITSKQNFFIDESTKLTVFMMFKRDDFSFGSDQNLNCQILELPYTSKTLSMFVLLPIEKFGLKKLESKLTVENLSNLLDKMRKVKVEVHIPKFKIETSISLNDILKTMGMKDLFDPSKADLSGIDDTRDLFVTEVVHKAFLEVNEEGSEASAASAAIAADSYTRSNPKKFTADHPFIIFIRDNSTKSILFWSRVVNPS